MVTDAVTADELLAMPDDGFLYELIEGELRRMSPAGSEHGAIGMRFGVILGSHVQSKDLGVVFGPDTGFRIASAPDTVRAPDVSFVRRERIPDDRYSSPTDLVRLLESDVLRLDDVVPGFECNVAELLADPRSSSR